MDSQKQTQLPPQDGSHQTVDELKRRVHTLESSASRGVKSNIDGSYEFYDTNDVKRLVVGKRGEDDWGVRRYSSTGDDIIRPHFLLYNPIDLGNQTIGGGAGAKTISWAAVTEEIGYTWKAGSYIPLPRSGPWGVTVQLAYEVAAGGDNFPFWLFIYKTSFITDNPTPNKRLVAEDKASIPGINNYIRASFTRNILENEVLYVDHISNNGTWDLLNGEYDTYISCTYLGED